MRIIVVLTDITSRSNSVVPQHKPPSPVLPRTLSLSVGNRVTVTLYRGTGPISAFAGSGRQSGRRRDTLVVPLSAAATTNAVLALSRSPNPRPSSTPVRNHFLFTIFRTEGKYSLFPHSSAFRQFVTWLLVNFPFHCCLFINFIVLFTKFFTVIRITRELLCLEISERYIRKTGSREKFQIQSKLDFRKKRTHSDTHSQLLRIDTYIPSH